MLPRPYQRVLDIIADAAFHVKSPSGFHATAVILHGASCVGKSSLLRKLRRRITGCVFVEMDDFEYWKHEAACPLHDDVFRLLTEAGVNENQARELSHSIERCNRTYCGDRTRVMVELLGACRAHDAVISTCGNLPPPHEDHDFYRLLATHTGMRPLHVLLAPSLAVQTRYIRSRGRSAKMDGYIADQRKRLHEQANYDLVLNGGESTAGILEWIRAPEM